MKLIEKLRVILGGNYSISELRKRGITIGNDCHIYTKNLDFGHGYLITIGNKVTLASAVRILTHDASTKRILGYSKIGRVDIGDNVFIGAESIVLPNVRIGDNVIIGAGSVVVKDIPSNVVAVGNPCRVVGDYDSFVKKNQALFEVVPHQDSSFEHKSKDEKEKMKNDLEHYKWGFDI